jgi:hypothetical protein
VTVCAWCSALVSRQAAPSGFERNYGMCRDCVEEQLARLGPKSRRSRPAARSARKRLALTAERSYDLPACSGEGISARSL